jgi:hypothetical protein
MNTWPTLATEPTIEAIRLLGVYTAGRFDIWLLAGQPKASCRAHIMSVLTGIKTPQRKAGVNALREAFYLAGGIEGDCLAAKEDNFLAWVREVQS